MNRITINQWVLVALMFVMIYLASSSLVEQSARISTASFLQNKIDQLNSDIASAFDNIAFATEDDVLIELGLLERLDPTRISDESAKTLAIQEEARASVLGSNLRKLVNGVSRDKEKTVNPCGTAISTSVDR